MNQNGIIIASIVGFIVITTLSVFIYFQNPTAISSTGIDCSFVNDSLLNYLHNPQCNRPLGIELLENYQCVVLRGKIGFDKVECEDPNKAWVQSNCLNVQLNETTTLTQCP